MYIEFTISTIRLQWRCSHLYSERVSETEGLRFDSQLRIFCLLRGHEVKVQRSKVKGQRSKFR
ncbi:unnamed protein product, partial [Callosobruchus maculatus]